MLLRMVGVTAFAFLSSNSWADDTDVVARAFHSDPQYVTMNIPPRPDAWPGAIFTVGLRIPIIHGDPKDPAIHRGNPVALDADTGFDLNAKAQGGMSFLFGASASVNDAADVRMSFPDARVSDMDLGELRRHVIASEDAIDAAKRGLIPLVFIKSYSGTPTVTIKKRAGASAEAWAEAKKDIKVGASAGASGEDQITYKGSEEIVFAYETAQVTFDPKDLSKGVYTIQFAALPGVLYASREQSTDEQFAQILAGASGISVADIKKGAIAGGPPHSFGCAPILIGADFRC